MSASSSSQDLLDVGKVSDNYFLLNLIQKSKANGPRKTFKPPESSALSRVKDFLPEMERAQQELQKHIAREPGSVDIEDVRDGDGHIEMNIAVVEDPCLVSSESDSDSSDGDSDCELVGEECADGASRGCRPMPAMLGEVTEDNIRLAPLGTNTCKQPVIEVLDDSGSPA